MVIHITYVSHLLIALIALSHVTQIHVGAAVSKFLQKNEVNNEVLRTVKVTLGSINFTILPMFLDVQKRNRRLIACNSKPASSRSCSYVKCSSSSSLEFYGS